MDSARMETVVDPMLAQMLAMQSGGMVGSVSHTCDGVIPASVVSVSLLVGNVAARSSSAGGGNPLLVIVGAVPKAVAHVPV